MNAVTSALTFSLPLILFAVFCKTMKFKNAQNVFLSVAFLYFVFFVGFRDLSRVGNDSLNYVDFFQWWGNMTWRQVVQSDIAETGYALLNKLIFSIYADKQFMAIVIAILTMLGPYILIKNHSSNKYLSTFIFALFFLFSATNTMRKNLALSFLCLTYNFMGKKQYTFGAICSLAAFSFHNTALVGIAFLVFFAMVKQLHLRRSTGLNLSLLAGIIIAASIVPLIDFASEIFGKYGSYSVHQVGFSFYNLLILLYITIIILLCIKFFDSDEKRRRHRFFEPLTNTRGSIGLTGGVKGRSVEITDVMFWALIIGVLCSVISVRFLLFDRVVSFFFISVVILVPELAGKSKSKKFTFYVYCILAVHFSMLLLVRPEWTMFPHYFAF